jgi:hypothetical protein
VAKDQGTVISGSNTNGDYKLKPVVTYHAENPRAMRGFLKSSLPVYWQSGLIFTEWCNNQLHHELKAYCKAENMERFFLCWIMLLDVLL